MGDIDLIPEKMLPATFTAKQPKQEYSVELTQVMSNTKGPAHPFYQVVHFSQSPFEADPDDKRKRFYVDYTKDNHIELDFGGNKDERAKIVPILTSFEASFTTNKYAMKVSFADFERIFGHQKKLTLPIYKSNIRSAAYLRKDIVYLQTAYDFSLDEFSEEEITAIIQGLSPNYTLKHVGAYNQPIFRVFIAEGEVNDFKEELIHQIKIKRGEDKFHEFSIPEEDSVIRASIISALEKKGFKLQYINQGQNSYYRAQIGNTSVEEFERAYADIRNEIANKEKPIVVHLEDGYEAIASQFLESLESAGFKVRIPDESRPFQLEIKATHDEASRLNALLPELLYTVKLTVSPRNDGFASVTLSPFDKEKLLRYLEASCDDMGIWPIPELFVERADGSLDISIENLENYFQFRAYECGLGNLATLTIDLRLMREDIKAWRSQVDMSITPREDGYATIAMTSSHQAKLQRYFDTACNISGYRPEQEVLIQREDGGLDISLRNLLLFFTFKPYLCGPNESNSMTINLGVLRDNIKNIRHDMHVIEPTFSLNSSFQAYEKFIMQKLKDNGWCIEQHFTDNNVFYVFNEVDKASLAEGFQFLQQLSLHYFNQVRWYEVAINLDHVQNIETFIAQLHQKLTGEDNRSKILDIHYDTESSKLVVAIKCAYIETFNQALDDTINESAIVSLSEGTHTGDSQSVPSDSDSTASRPPSPDGEPVLMSTTTSLTAGKTNEGSLHHGHTEPVSRKHYSPG